MEILDRLKSMVGVGAPTIELTGIGPFRAGELLCGRVVLRGGEYDAPVKDISLHLDEERLTYNALATPDRQFWRRVAELVITLDGRVLQKGELLELPFELVTPRDLTPNSDAVTYALVAETEVPGLNPRAQAELTLEA